MLASATPAQTVAAARDLSKEPSLSWYSDHKRLASGENDPSIRIFAATIGQNPNEDAVPATALAIGVAG